jgi:UDP:flavonoid glycosyltransferase YjiC (YdhE family)
LITELLDKNVPFLWSHASPFAVVPPELAQRIDANDKAHHSRWVPQLAVLAHPATGWFINHGGWNSIQEALALRVPM